jgi:hypothetical protein
VLTFCINPLSANGQCADSQRVGAVVKSLVDCFDYLLPALDKRRARLIYDSGVERRQLKSGESFLASVNNLPRETGGRDTRVRWFAYTKNRANRPESGAVVSVVVSSPDLSLGQITGEISERLIQENSGWLSFGGHPLHEMRELRVQTDSDRTFQLENAYNLDSFRPLLPRYQASPKHRRVAYYDSKGQKVSCMPLDDNEAQRLLLASLGIAGDRWAFHERRSKCYCFKVTSANIYHGFELEREEVPQHIWTTLEGAGIIPKRASSGRLGA